ncbi:MAG: type II secretion system F family protein [Bacteroidetes bacterium]|nr:type II secretion system F family protein [Bacteroidota bacterium]
MKTISDKKKEMLFSEFHSLLISGLDFSRAFKMLISSENEKNIKISLEEIYESVIKGENLGKAFESSHKFSTLDCGVITIGEETGKLCEAFFFLADYYESKVAQKRMIIGASSYPIIIMCVAVIVLVFMILVIVPMFEQVYARMGGEMPAITQLIIKLSKNFHYYLFGIFTIIIICWLFLFVYGKRERVLELKSKIMLNTPMLGMFIRKNTQARFCKLLFLLYSSGVPLLRGINMLTDIITFYPYRKSFKDICEGLNKGDSIADVMERNSTIYDKKLIVLIRVGEQTNRLGQMLQKQGDDITKELNYKLKGIGNILEPVLILFVGVIVAFILIAMYMPMFMMGGIIN